MSRRGRSTEYEVDNVTLRIFRYHFETLLLFTAGDIMFVPESKVPNDLLVAHAEKRVLQGALDQAAQQAADAEV